MLTLTAPELTVLVGGLRVLGANAGGSKSTECSPSAPGTLTNDFFANLLDMSTRWKPVEGFGRRLRGARPQVGRGEWTARRADLIFGSHSQLRALAEVYGSSDGKEKFVKDFAKAWAKVMNLDRYDLVYSRRPLAMAAE